MLRPTPGWRDEGVGDGWKARKRKELKGEHWVNEKRGAEKKKKQWALTSWVNKVTFFFSLCLQRQLSSTSWTLKGVHPQLLSVISLVNKKPEMKILFRFYQDNKKYVNSCKLIFFLLKLYFPLTVLCNFMCLPRVLVIELLMLNYNYNYFVLLRELHLSCYESQLVEIEDRINSN